ncbi:MAG: FtsK/SpoIIIE domain-containing protein [Peptococcaceae bacterium]|nr:FtsK/SpoIIIE domain-containing protein [Peptococcaceae bacterium]
MIVTLVFLQGIYTTTLPDEKLGLFYLHNSLTPNPNNQLVAIEGIDDAWVVKSNRKITLLDENNTPVPSLILKPGTMYSLSSNKPGHIMKIYTESVTTGRQHYTKYSVGNLDTISIGRSENNIIIIDSPYVSSHHAELHAKKTASPCWSFSDQGSTNGTYINNKRGKSELLANGDMVTIVAGCQFFIVGETLAVNNPSGRVRINTALLKPIENLLNLVPADDTDRDEDTVSFKPDQYFETHQRSPRFTQDFPKPVFNAQEPPENQIGQETPFLFTLGPAITMGMASAVMILFSINKAMSDGDIAAATPSIAMATSMLAGVVLWPILSNRFDKKRRRAKETLRQNKYKDYIKTFDTTLNEECARQTALLVKTWPHISDCIKLILNKQRDLWEREPGQDDFLTFRIGTGQRELEADIRYPEDKFSLEDDNLKQELRSVCQTPRILMNVPLTVSLFEDPIIGIIGDRRQIVDFITRLLIKTVALYSYDDVKIVLIYAPEEEDAFGFGRWLPHIWTNTRSFRYIASTEEELKELSFVLQQEIDRRLHINDRDTDPGPYYIIFSLSHTLAQKTDVLKQIYAAQKTSRLKNLRMSVVAAYDKLANLPKESTLVVDVYNSNRASTSELSGEIARKLSGKISEGTTGKITYDEQYAGKYYNKNTPNVITSFISDVLHFKATPDTAITYSQINKLAVELALKLANIRLDSLVGAFQLPALFPFLSMFKVGKIEHLNPMTRWRENNPVKSLQAPVGINTTGDAFKLDIHEKVHGPHGLIAGMTGSGKSEFIMTFILSLAVNYHPHEVAFVLIDYKGGGMAKTFAPLPHTAGIITNLDGAALKRSLVSIQSELKRRQALFSDTSKHLDVSNIDIYTVGGRSPMMPLIGFSKRDMVMGTLFKSLGV